MLTDRSVNKKFSGELQYRWMTAISIVCRVVVRSSYTPLRGAMVYHSTPILYPDTMERLSCLILGDSIICCGFIIICSGFTIIRCGFIIICCGTNIICSGSSINVPKMKWRPITQGWLKRCWRTTLINRIRIRALFIWQIYILYEWTRIINATF